MPSPTRDGAPRSFIRKVYGIISAMLAFTFALTFLFVYDAGVKSYVQRNPGFLIAAFVVEFATICALACSRNLARKTPHNYIVLASACAPGAAAAAGRLPSRPCAPPCPPQSSRAR